MVVKIKVFQYVRKSYQAIGLDPIQSNPTPLVLNERVFFIAISILQMFISSTAFLIFEAGTVQEFTSSFYTSITNLFLLVNFLALATKTGDTSKVIEAFEEFIEKSEVKIFCI